VLVPVLGKHKNVSETGAPDREPRHFRLNHSPEPGVVLKELAPRAINNHSICAAEECTIGGRVEEGCACVEFRL